MRRAALVLLLLAGCAGRPPEPAATTSAATASARIVDTQFALTGAVAQGSLVRGVAPAGTVTLRLGGQPVRLDAALRFAIGFGRDDAGPRPLDATLADGAVLRQQLTPAPRQWKIDRLPAMNSVTGEDNPDFNRRREAEVALLRAGKTGMRAADGWRQAFVWPAAGRISGVYGSQRILGDVPRNPHYGVDVAAPAGTLFVAPADGVVTLAQGPFAFEGNVVMLDHGNGLVSAFLHLSRFLVTAGQRVRQGEPLGAIGTTGRSTGPHLHWGMTLAQAGAPGDEVRIDPEPLVPPKTAENRTPERPQP